MRKATSLLILLAGFLNLAAQTKPERSPLNPEFINFVEYSKTEGSKKSSGEYRKGYVPTPMNIHFNSRDVQLESKKSMQELPIYYNLKDYGWVTPVRDQGPVGACWSFSTMGAIESRWLKLGFGTAATLNLSEQNMATCHGFEAGIDDGGSDYIASAYLSRLSGPVTEASHPYSPIATATCKTSGLVKPAYSPQTIYLPKDINIVKKAIMDYGAVTASIRMGLYTRHLSTSNSTYLYIGTEPVDHGVLVVGWDDSLKVTGRAYQPVNKGAWIVKNSWGTLFGDAGYFYVSYEDSKFLSSCSVYPERIEIEAIDTMIMYDWLGATSSYGFRADTASAVTKFQSTQQIFIDKIGTFVNASGSFIDIEIYKKFTGDSVLSDLVASSHNNFCKFPGYYTFNVPALVQGDYYVKIKYFTPGYNYPIPVETEIVYQGEAYALPNLEPAGRFWISRDEKKWSPLGSDIEDYEADLSIRVYADQNTSLNAFFTANKNITCINGDFIFTDASNGTINSYAWNFGEGASPATANTKGPHTVTYSTEGLKSISLTVTGPSGTEVLSKNSYVEVVTALDIFLPYSEKLLVSGKSIAIVAYGADTYSWSPSAGLNTTSGELVMASPTDTTKYTVTGTMGACSGSASITINTVESPANDDVCNAYELPTGNYLYNNIYATVEDGEPAPPEGDCEAALEWCVEGGLQNSVWFWFIAPPGGKVSLTTLGMDTQMAVYKAETCDSILLAKPNLIAASDDYFNEDNFFAAALDMINVIPGEKYFIQIDGSAGGDEGDFRLIYWEAPVSVEQITKPEELKLYPNPNFGEFRFEYNSETSESLRIRVLNSKGQELYLEEFRNSSKSTDQQINLGEIDKGIYIFELTSGQKVLRKNFVIQ